MKKKFRYKYNSYVFKCLDKNREVMGMFFKNNSYLLKKANKSLYMQIKELKEIEGLELGEGYIYRLKNGKKNSMNITMLHIFSIYWNRDLIDMIGYDIEGRERLSE